MTRRKKLIEVALPLEAINRESAREKSIRHGHPSTLHLWWARRPLAACRAVLFAQFVDDPDSDPAYRNADGSVDEERAGLKRAQLFNLIEELVKWENSNNDCVINAARAEIARCLASRLIEEGKFQKETIIYGKDEGKPHPKGPISGEFRTAWELIIYGNGDLEALDNRTTRLCPANVVNHFLATYAPPVLDPFAGGGSIPLEAQRLGLRAHASDLNPVPVLINKALIEIPPRFANMPPVNPEAQKALGTATYRGAEGLAEDVRYYGKWMRDEAEKRIGHLYPKVKITEEMAADRPDLEGYVGQQLPALAWIWTRTVPSPDPALGGAQVPLVRSFWLNKRGGKEAYVHPTIDRDNGEYDLTVRTGKPCDGFDPDIGTIKRAGGRCLLTEASMGFPHIREAGKAGEMRLRLMAIVADGDKERVYIDPLALHVEAALEVTAPWKPNQELPQNPRDFKTPNYGMTRYGDLFTERQLAMLAAFSDLVIDVVQKVSADATSTSSVPDEGAPLADGGTGRAAYAHAVATYLGLSLGKLTVFHNTLTRWRPGEGKSAPAFGRQALPMVWDFPELNPFAGAGGDWLGVVDGTSGVLCGAPAEGEAIVRQLNATVQAAYGEEAVSCDPPYYDNIGYADLSDFFYIWLRRTLRSIHPETLSTMMTPKSEELIATPYRHDGSVSAAADFFEKGLATVIAQWRKHGCHAVPTTVFYAFKQAETDAHGTASTGWETFLSGVLESGFAVTGTWPMRTESTTRLIGMASNALASSVVLACVPRSEDAPMATRREFLNALKRELPDALRKLQIGNIAPVDMAQAAIGPGMGVFSRYSRVVESDGSAMTVRTALTLINQVLDEVLAEQEGEFDGDTRWAVAWFEQHGVDEGPFGVAETLSKAKNTSVQGLVEAGIVEARSGNVKLLSRDDIPEGWDPTTDNRPTCWEATQHLICRLQNHGEQSAADLLALLGADYGEMARDLAYRLYSICERKGWAQEALAYNSLVIAWSEISKLSRTASESKPAKSAGLFE